MSRFVKPETRTLTLANGDHLTVRARLSAGERRAHYARIYMATGDGRLHPIPFMNGIGIVVAYLLDWTLTDDAGTVVPIRDLPPEDLQRVVDGLDEWSFDEIREAIVAHEAGMVAAREAEKKTDGTTGSS